MRGARRCTRWPSASTARPPGPKATTGPAEASRTAPTRYSSPGGTSGCTRAPSQRAPARAAHSSTTRPASAGSVTGSRRNPASPLCTTPATEPFTATGPPVRAAAAAASRPVVTQAAGTVGSPAARQRDSTSGGRSHVPSGSRARAVRTRSCAARVSTPAGITGADGLLASQAARRAATPRARAAVPGSSTETRNSSAGAPGRPQPLERGRPGQLHVDHRRPPSPGHHAGDDPRARIADRRRRGHGEDGVHRRALEQAGECGGERLRGHGGAGVDGIGRAGQRRQERAQPGLELVGQRLDAQAGGDAGVRRHDAPSPDVGEHRDRGAGGQRLAPQQRHGRGQVGQGGDRLDAAGGVGRLAQGGGGGGAGRVRGRRALSRRGRPGRQGEHRHARREMGSGPDESPEVRLRLRVQDDQRGARVLVEPGQDVARAHVQRVTDGHHGGQAEAEPSPRGHGGDRHAAGLRHQADVAGRRAFGGERGVQPAVVPRTDDADRVRSDDAHPVAVGQRPHPRAAPGDRAQPGRDDHERPHPVLAALLDRRLDRRRGHGDHRQVDRRAAARRPTASTGRPRSPARAGSPPSTSPRYPEERSLRSTARPMDCSPRPAPITTTASGSSTARSPAAAAARCRASVAAAYRSSACRATSMRSDVPSRVVPTGRPRSRRTRSISRFSARTSAISRPIPRCRPRAARCSSRTVASPRSR